MLKVCTKRPVKLSNVTRFSHHLHVFVLKIRMQHFCFKYRCLLNHRKLSVRQGQLVHVTKMDGIIIFFNMEKSEQLSEE